MPASAPTSTAIHAPVTGRYRVDPERTTVTVAARHMFGLGRVTGTITMRTAEVTVADPISESRVQARLDATTFKTGNPARDRAVRSAKYLDAEAHPEISFHADGLRDDGVVTGTVIAHGAAAATELTVEEIEQFGDVLMVRAKCRVDRYAHGVTAGKGVAGRWITVRIDATCCRIGED